MKTLLKIDSYISKTVSFLCVVMLVAIVLIGAAQIFFRYILNSSLLWSEEIIRFLFIWLSFVASSITVRNEGHVGIDALVLYLKPRPKMIMYIISRLVCVAFLIIMVPAGYQLVIHSVNSRASTIPLTFNYVYASFLVGAILSLLSFAVSIPRYAKKISRGE